jgi:hypothetical protein
MLGYGPIPHVTDDDIRRMAREAEAENRLLPALVRKKPGWYYRRAAVRLGLVPLAELTVDELAWRFAVAVANAR